MVTPTMSSGIGSSERWLECQKELIAMNDKIIELNNCLIVWQKICKHLETSNETLVAIVERCPLSGNRSQDMAVLIAGVQQQEEYVLKEKQNLKTFDTKCDFNDKQVFDFIDKWKDCQPMTTSSTQTEDNRNQWTITETVVKCEDNLCDNEMLLIPKEEINESMNGFNEDNHRLDVLSDDDFDIEDDMAVDDSDSDFEISSKRFKRRKAKTKKNVINKCKDRITLSQKSVLEMKVSGYYVCNETNCDYKSKMKQRFLKHLRRHYSSVTIITDSQTIDLAVIPYIVDDYYLCNECQLRCDDKYSFYDHIQSHEKTMTSIVPKDVTFKMMDEFRVDENYVCNQSGCDFETNDKKEFFSHYKRHSMATTTEVQLLTTEMIDECNVDDTYVCNRIHCDYESNSRKNFIIHFRHHFEPKDKFKNESLEQKIERTVVSFKVDDSYVCTQSDCSFTSCDKNVFYDHFREHEPEVMVTTTEMITERKVGDYYVCDQNECKYNTKDRGNFIKHFRRHFDVQTCHMSSKSTKEKTNDKINSIVLLFEVDDRYVCTLNDCQFGCDGKEAFYSHLKETHQSFLRHVVIRDGKIVERPNACPWPGCEMAFRTKRALKGHLDIHNDNRKFVCEWPGCEYKCFGSWHLRTHQLTHTNTKPLECAWPGCVFRCKSPWALVSHKRKHTGEKPHVCQWPDCHFRTSQTSALTIHMRRHTGEKPYVCDIDGCALRFSSPAGIYAHKRSRHRNRQ